jgi:hypothetical protein
MVMGHQHGAEVVEAKAVSLHFLFEPAGADSRIYDDSGLAAAALFRKEAEEVAIAAASG